MKNNTFLVGLFSLVLLSGCISFNNDDDQPPIPQSNYEAVVMEREVFENSVQILPVQSVEKSGKIYIKENFMFINEVNKGFHVYNYDDPQNPVAVAFIQLLGATDLAVRGNVIYINQAVDLVALTYDSSANTIAVTHRIENVFPQKPGPNFSYADITENQIIVDWILNN